MVKGVACMVKGDMHGKGGHAWQRGACMEKGGMHGKGGMCGEGGMHGKGGVHGEGGGMHGEGRCMAKGGMYGKRRGHARLETRPMQRAVRILLECILVVNLKFEVSRLYRNFLTPVDWLLYKEIHCIVFSRK